MWKVVLLQISLLLLIRIIPAQAELSEGPYCPLGDLQRQVNEMKGIFREIAAEFRRLQMASDFNNMMRIGSGMTRLRGSGQTSKYKYLLTDIVDETSFCNMHDHPEFNGTCGLGELPLCVNGVCFGTRHNDYKMRRKHTTLKGLDNLEDIDCPDVPPSVLDKDTVDEQVEEMREYFRAFLEQNTTRRPDFEQYFPPYLCYAEVYWMNVNRSTISEGSTSERHKFSAPSFELMEEQAEFFLRTGHKQLREDCAFMQGRFRWIDSDNKPVVEQLMYRILCHPIPSYINFKKEYIEPRSDTATMVRLSKVWGKGAVEDLDQKRSTLFRVRRRRNEDDSLQDRNLTYLDKIFKTIPGLSNLGNKQDVIEGETAMQVRDDGKLLPQNGCMYHRAIQASFSANGINIFSKSYSDEYLYAAMNTEEKVPPIEFRSCNAKATDCSVVSQRWSHAIPLEIIYMNPLCKWNPHKIKHRGEAKTAEGELIYEGCNDKACDGKTSETPFNGVNGNNQFTVPASFFSTSNNAGVDDPADTTSKSAKWVLGGDGKAHPCQASGIRIHTDHGFGRNIRWRFPIIPLAEEKSHIYTELSALREMVTQPAIFRHLVNSTDPNV